MPELGPIDKVGQALSRASMQYTVTLMQIDRDALKAEADLLESSGVYGVDDQMQLGMLCAIVAYLERRISELKEAISR